MEQKICKCSKEQVKQIINERLPYEDVISAFEKCDYDVDEFFLTRANDDFQDLSFYITVFLELKDELQDYWVDIANGHWDIPEEKIDVPAVFRSFWFAKTDSDMWELLYNLPLCLASRLYRCYTGRTGTEWSAPCYLKDSDKAHKMLEFFLEKMYAED